MNVATAALLGAILSAWPCKPFYTELSYIQTQQGLHMISFDLKFFKARQPMQLPICLALCLGMLGSLAMAQNFPAKPLRYVTASAAGGGTEAMLRTVTAQMAKELGQTIAVDNKPSAGGIAAVMEVLRAPADGYTLLAADNGMLVHNPAVYKKLPYDPNAFAPLGVIARAPLMLVASQQSGYKTAKDFLDAVRANPGKVAYASPGTGSPGHLAMEVLRSRAGMQMARVPFGSDAAAVKDVLDGSLPVMVIDLPSALPHLRAGKLIALATFSKNRVNAASEAPTVAELGFINFEAYMWQGLAVPVATAKDVQTKLAQSMQAALGNSAIRKSLADTGWEFLASDPGLMTATIMVDSRVWHRIIKDSGISAD
jgi:tripartite-type tricarboxylate transporter receptor subunit TctC